MRKAHNTTQCVRSIKLSLIMIMAICLFNLSTLKAQWGVTIPLQGFVSANTNNPEQPIPGTDQAVIINSALYECTGPAIPADHRATLGAIVWADLNGNVHLFVEYAQRDYSTVLLPPNCYSMAFPPTNNTIQVNTSDAIHPDVIIRDHIDNPGIDYIVSVVYNEGGFITLNEYEITGLPTVNINLLSSTQLSTSTYMLGDEGAYPKIDGFVNPNNFIHNYNEMGGFAVVWETANGVELQVFDANSTPFYETQIPITNPNYPYMRYTPDIAAIVDIDGTGPNGYRQIACVSFDNALLVYPLGGDIAVHEYDVTSGVTTPMSVYNKTGPTVLTPNSRIDGMGILTYDSTRWVVVSTSDCGGGKVHANSSSAPWASQYIPGNPTMGFGHHSGFNTYTVTAGVGTVLSLPPGSVSTEAGNIQYPFGMASYYGVPADVFLNSVNPNTAEAYDPGLLPDFCMVNCLGSVNMPYNNCANTDDPYAGQAYTMSTSCNSGYDLLAAWIDVGNNIWYKYSCRGDLDPNGTTPFSPMNGQIKNIPIPSSINVYPNPAQDYLFISIKEDIIPQTLSVYDIYGRLVAEKNIEGQKSAELELKEFITGIYRIDITDTKSKRYGKTVMIEK